MSTHSHRRRTVQHLLSAIGDGVDRGDGVAAILEIQSAARDGTITDQDANRLLRLAAQVLGDGFLELRRLLFGEPIH